MSLAFGQCIIGSFEDRRLKRLLTGDGHAYVDAARSGPHRAAGVPGAAEPDVTEGAKALGVTRQALNNLVNGKSGISAEMAVRLAAAFRGGAEFWLRMQSNYDLAEVKKREPEIVATVRHVERPEVRT